MSFLGSIGYIMSNSGLEQALETIYAKNTIVHMMSGKAISRALRGHFIVDTALNGLLLSKELQSGSVEEQGNPSKEIFTEVELLNSQLMNGEPIQNICQSKTVTVIQEMLTSQKESLQTNKTANLWLQYMEMVDILRKYIRAERLGNWNLHLQATSEMLPYFAATGHNHYLKSSYVYLQNMHNLEQSHPVVYHHFSNGLHVIRRSDRQWGGLSADLVIEQCLMRNLKTSTGLTRGRGMTEQQRNIWTLSMPVCAEVHHSLQELSGTIRRTGEQNEDMAPSRVSRDWQDTNTIKKFLEERDPFECGQALYNIANGVHAQASVNVEKAKTIGETIIEKMIGVKVSDYSFKRKDQAVTLASKAAVKVDGESIQVDPMLLFQRLTLAAKSDLENALKYELCTFLPALFETPELLNEAQKSTLADALWACTNQNESLVPESVRHVVDGGALLYRIPWARGSSFSSIIKTYTDYVSKRYGEAFIVFDGYEGISTKDMTHRRRSKGKKGLTVSFTLDMCLSVSKDIFLNDPTNKQNFICLLGIKLREQNCQVFHSRSDADLLIVQKTVESAESVDTVLVGDDTDLLVLLIYHVNLDNHDIFFIPEPKKNSKCRTWNIKQVKADLGSFTCKHILFLHALLGCDTTSRLYGIGKGPVLKKFKGNSCLQQAANIFDSTLSTSANIESAGEQALVAIYNGKRDDSLDALRHKKYCEKVATSSTHVEPKSLPPTSAAAKYHSYRVFYQICQWKKSDSDLLPELWGWTETETGLYPTLTDLPPAPEDMLKIIKCTCTGDCTSARCSCKKNGMKCSPACNHCRGSACLNASIILEDEEASYEEQP